MIVYGKDRKLQVRSEVWGGKGDTYQRDMLSEELGERPAHYKLMTEIEYPPGSELGYHQHVGTSPLFFYAGKETYSKRRDFPCAEWKMAHPV